MKVTIADNAGACYGVKRAVEMAFCARKNSENKVYTYGSLIHNPLVVEDLKSQGIYPLDEIKGDSSSTIVIRSHGATPCVYEKINLFKMNLVDATCPHVLAAQRAVKELAASGHKLIVVGDKNHAEVKGICAQAPNDIFCVIQNPHELPHELPKKIGVVVQTTQTQETLNSVIAALKNYSSDITLKNTICSATSKRQDSSVKLAQKVDVMIVIGGHNSANTIHLASLCSKFCKTFHVENVDELKEKEIGSCTFIGITAGASTFYDQIDAVRKYLESL